MNEAIDHYVWEAFYIPDHWDDKRGTLVAATKEVAMNRIAEEADVPNAGWEEDTDTDGNPRYQLHRTTHHIVTVVRRPFTARSVRRHERVWHLPAVRRGHVR